MEHIIAKLLQDFDQGKMNRRQLIQSLALAATAASAVASAPPAAGGTQLKAVSVGHISFDVKDYHKVQDWYADLFGMKPFNGTKTDNEGHVRCGDTYLTFRNSKKAGTPRVDHIAVGVEPWDNEKDSSIKGAGPRLEAELRRRGYKVEPTGDVKVQDPEGYIVQLVGKSYQTRF